MTEHTPKVTVMLPSYNHEKYVAEAIESCLAQTFGDYELLISDDCSPDKTFEIAKEYMDERIVFHRFEHNVGAAENHRYCYAHAKGEYIALLNSDDVWMPEHLEGKVEYLDAHPECGAVFSWAMAIDEDSQVIDPCMEVFRQENRTRQEWLLRLFTGGNCICHPSMLIRREVYDRVGFYWQPFRQLPDFYQWIRILKQYSIHVIPQTQVKHRRCIRTMGNTSAPILPNSIRDVNESSMILRHFFDGMSDEFFRETFHSLFRRPEASTHEELICEKFFLMLDGKYYMTMVTPLAAYQFFSENCSDPEVLRTMYEAYGYSINEYYKLGASLNIYRLGEAPAQPSPAVESKPATDEKEGPFPPFHKKYRLLAILWAVFGPDSAAYRWGCRQVQKRLQAH